MRQRNQYATVAQLVEQLIRNQQVVCSSHISSSKKGREIIDFPAFFYVKQPRGKAGLFGLFRFGWFVSTADKIPPAAGVWRR